VAVSVTGLPLRVPDVAVRVFVPAVVPSVQLVTAAIPLLPVRTAVVGTTVPAPEATANVTLTLATGLLKASRTITEGGIATAVPTVALWLFPAFTAIDAAVPAVPVAVNVTGLPESVPEVAVSVFVPAVVPSVQLVTVAMPSLPVRTAVVGATVPPPDATAKVTLVPATGLLKASCTITAGRVATAVPTVALWLFPAFTAIDVAVPAVPVAVNVTGLPVSPADVAVRVLVPAVVPRVQFVTAATPLLPVRTAVVGATVPPPDATANVTLVLATGLLNWSVTKTAGGVVTAVPTMALSLFPALTAIAAAPAALTITVGWAVIATELMVAETVFVPAAVELKAPVNTPLLFVVPPDVSVLPDPVAERATVAPPTGFPAASFAVTVMVLWIEPALAVMVPGEATTVDWVGLTVPAVPVAVKVTGLPLSVPDVAVSVFVPAVVPSVQFVVVAMPLLPVVTAVVGTTEPPPEATANVTLTFATGLLKASRTMAAGGVATALPAVAL
jgi:hypothetical protein